MVFLIYEAEIHDILRCSRNWNEIVANKVAELHPIIEILQWRYCLVSNIFVYYFLIIFKTNRRIKSIYLRKKCADGSVAARNFWGC